MPQKILRPKLDPVFKGLFKNDETLLKPLLEALLDYPAGTIREVTVADSEIVPEGEGDKAGFMDLKVWIDSAVVNVEMQLQSQDSYRERAMYYWARAYTNDFREGYTYDKLKKTISINIVDFRIFDAPEICSVFTLTEAKRREQLTDKCCFIFFELPKLKGGVDMTERQKLWLNFIDAETEEDIASLNKLEVPEIKKAIDKLEKISADPFIRERILRYEKQLSDEANIRATDLRIGREEGRKEVIDQLRKSGMPDEEIQRILRL
ncbi:MAG: Rpn family recombination-promoting nuclease/putative transposase [Bacteroides sp.]|nr:Rpn family recombination-promoting nuclease/putative transposase [Bacteroides sp.]